MSMKKATPKAVFEACEQLEQLDHPWNRDDVRLTIGGGSFSVIDPLIQAWRKLQPVREVAPSVPSDLLIQVAKMLEQQVSDYLANVELRDQKREQILFKANEAVAENLQAMEADLGGKLDVCQQANHDLEAEYSRKENELNKSEQSRSILELELQVSKEAVATLNQRLTDLQQHHESTIKQQNQAQQEKDDRTLTIHKQQVNELKLEFQQQLSQQRSELMEASQLTEDRLMRLLDQGRSELKEAQASFSHKFNSINRELQSEKQLVSQQEYELKSLHSTLAKIKEDAHQQALQQSSELEAIKIERQILQQQAIEKTNENIDMAELKESILALQTKLLNP